MLSEKMMEDAICADPEKYLKEKGLKLIARQYSIGNYRFDLLFETRHADKLIVEIQKGTLDREHYLKVLDYYYEYQKNNPKEFIHLKVVANRIPHEMRKKMRALGIDYLEINEGDFIIEETEKNEEKTNKINVNHHPEQPIVKSQESLIIDKYNTIDLRTTKGLFQNVFDRCDEYLKNLFSKLAKMISGSFSVEHYPTDKPDYRFRKKNIFCELVLKPTKGCLQVLLRVDSYHIDSQTLSLKEMPASKMLGTKWVQFEINNEDQLNETLNLIKKVYEFSD